MFLRTRLFKVGIVTLLLILLIMADAGLTVQARPRLQDKPPFCPPYISFVNPFELESTEEPEADSAATAEAAPILDFCHLMAVLKGTNEVPQTADPDGTGMFLGYYNTKTGKFCYEIDVTNIAAATAAHMHMGGSGEAGDVYVPLTRPGAKGTVAACLPTNAKNKELIQTILANPSGFYVNVHNSEFPDGAIRGQLVGAANLNGTREVPGPGDPRGYGVGSVVYDPKAKTLCTALFVRLGELPASAAHIHQGAAGEAGDVFLPVGAPDKMGHAVDCIVGDTEENLAKIRALIENPDNFYINVHTTKYPQGALRSEQLTAVPDRMHLAGLD
jgi:hypothetical protein